MNFPENLKYTKTHEWVEDLGDGRYRIGITDYAQDKLGNLVYVNLPEEGDELESGEAFADVESVKAVSDVVSPADGDIIAVNEDLQDEPELMNNSPYEAWFVEAENLTFGEELMDAAAYEAFCAAEDQEG